MLVGVQNGVVLLILIRNIPPTIIPSSAFSRDGKLIYNRHAYDDNGNFKPKREDILNGKIPTYANKQPEIRECSISQKDANIINTEIDPTPTQTIVVNNKAIPTKEGYVKILSESNEVTEVANEFIEHHELDLLNCIIRGGKKRRTRKTKKSKKSQKK